MFTLLGLVKQSTDQTLVLGVLLVMWDVGLIGVE